MKQAIEKQSINFSQLMGQLLGLLTDKEQDIIERRFSLGGSKRQTLDKIGQSYSITRERVRQIEAVAIKKLARIAMDPSMRKIHDMACEILQSHGGVMSEDLLISAMLKNFNESDKIDVNAMKLAMRVSERLIKQDKNQYFKSFWRIKDAPLPGIKEVITDIKRTLKKEKNVLTFETIAKALPQHSEEMLQSVLQIDWDFLKTKNGWGLRSWRFINPRSIKDKIFITLNATKKPLHFTNIIKHVLNDFEGKKQVTPQAIHNELIRHPEFVLVGRGMYALGEWDLPAGTVADLIKSVLVENKGPMKRQDIINKVLEKRDVQLGTISLNLQKYPFFKRVGRAVYTYEGTLDDPSLRKRGRKPKKK